MKKFFEKFKNIYLDLLILFIISTIFLYAVILHINILSLKYIIPITITLIILCILNTLVVISKKLKKKPKKILTGVFTLLSVIFIILSFVLLNLFSSVKDMFSTKSFVEYKVMVNEQSEYEKLSDIDNKIIGYYEEDKYHEKAEEKLAKRIEANYIGYSTIEELEQALLNDEIDALIIIDSYLDVLDNSNELEDTTTKENNDFKDNTRVIYKFKIEVDNSKNTKKIDLEKGSFTIFVSGQDSYSSTISEASRSDVNLLVTVNLKTKQILLLSIPRDYYINIHGKGASDKLTHISIYGSETAAQSLGDYLDVDVDYYVKFNFTTFMKAIEYFLPLDVYSDYDFTTGVYDQTIGNSYTFSKGYNHITTGEMALQFVRARKNFAEGDRQRGINQSRMLRAVINKAATPSILLKYKDVMKSLEGTFLTNISDESIIQIIKYVLNHNGKFKMYNFSLDGYDASRSCYSSGSQLLYVMLPNTETIEQAKVHIQDIIAGNTPDIEIDASEKADPNNSASVSKTPYHETYVPSYNYSSSNNSTTTEDNKSTKEENDEEQDNTVEDENAEGDTSKDDDIDDNTPPDDKDNTSTEQEDKGKVPDENDDGTGDIQTEKAS